MTDIDCENFSGAVLEQAIRETPGRSPDVETNLAFANDPAMSNRALELGPAAAHVAAGGCDGDFVTFLDGIRRLRGDPAIDLHLAGHDGALGLVAAGKKAALDQRLIESDPFRHCVYPVATALPLLPCIASA